MKNILLTIVTMLTVSITMSAQDNNRPSRQGFDPAKMVEQRTEMMVKKYGLDEKQAAALKALNEKSLPQARMNGNRQRPEKADTAKAQRPRAERGMGNRQGEAGARQRSMGGRQGGSRGGAQFEEYNKELQKIMTPEQYKAYQEDMQNMRKGGPRGGFNGQRDGARSQRGAQQ